jgi:CRISPR-associated endonuclease Cas1
MVNGFRETDLRMLRGKLLHLEGKYSEYYFKEIFKLFPERLRPTNRIGYKAYDGLNNTFNLAYTLLFWKCYRALIKSHLEPYLGFLHNVRFGRPSLVCDFVELYRSLVDDFLIGFCQNLDPKDFSAKSETWNGKKSKRIYLSQALTEDLTEKLFDYFRKIVRVPRIMRGEHQELETLINEEAMLLGKCLRNERETWIPRVAIPMVSE